MRLMAIEECFKPETLKEASEIVSEYKGKALIVGGGLDITANRDSSAEALIFLDKIGLKDITEDGNEIRIGSRVSLNELVHSQALRNYMDGAVSEALRGISTELIRNQMTIGGSLITGRPFSDVATAFLALRADVIIVDEAGERRISLDEFYSLPKIPGDVIIKEICLNKGYSGYCFGMERFVRTATDMPLLNMAIMFKTEEGVFGDVSIATGSLKGPTERFNEGESYLTGKSLDIEAVDKFSIYVKENIKTLNDYRISGEYRKELAGVFAKRILLKAGVKNESGL